MWCEVCGHEGVAAACPRCGATRVVDRIAYRDQVRCTVLGWNRAGVVDAAALGAMLGQLAREKKALIALLEVPTPERPAPVPVPVASPVLPAPAPPAPAPRPLPPPRPARPPPPPPPVAWPTPREAAPRPARISLDGWLRESAGWLVGAALTVVGSVYLAGTLWDGLSEAWRTAITLAFLAVWSLGFGAVGRRLVARGLGAGRWLIGVGAALAPVHAMAAGALWPHWGAAVALAAVAAIQGWALWRAAGDLAPGGGVRLWAPWLGLALSAGWMPLHVGPVLPTLLAAAAAWGLGVRRGPALSVAALLALAWGLHPLFGGLGGAADLALPLALLSGVALYADLAWARWQGLARVGLEGWRGTAVAALALGALACTVPTFAPLPSGPGAFGTYVVVGTVAFAAVLAWRRPPLVGVTLFAAIGAALVVPSLARPLVELVSRQASQGLGYGGAPLPLAWRALTLLPLLTAWLAMAHLVPRTGWRQAPALREHMRRWAFGIGVALLAFSLSLPDDLRPFVLAAPAYAAVGLLRPRLAVPRPVEIAISTLPVAVGALWFALAPACLPASLGIPADAGRFAMAGWLCAVALAWRDRTAAVAALPIGLVLAVLDPTDLGPLGAGLVGFAWLSAPARDPDRPRWAARVDEAVAAVAPALLLVGLGLQGFQLSATAAPWALLGGTVAAAAGSAWLRRRDRSGELPLLGWASVGVVAVAVAGLALDDPARLALRACLGALLLAWTREHRDLRLREVPVAPLFGAAVAAGVAEGVGRRLWSAGFEPGAVVAGAALAVAAWAALTARIGAGRPWIADGVALPARWVGVLAVLGGVGCAVVSGGATPVAVAMAALPLVFAAWLLAPRGDDAPGWVAVAVGASSKAVAVPAGLALGLVAVPGAGAAAIGISALSGAWHGPTGPGWVGLAAAAAALAIRARREPWLRAPAIVAAVGVAGLALEAAVQPAPAVHLLALVGAGSALAAARLPWVRAPWREEAAVTGHWLVMAAIPLLVVEVVLRNGPVVAGAALLATGYALAARQPWPARASAAVALVAALLWWNAPLPVWVLCGTAALIADHLAVGWGGRTARPEEALLHAALAVALGVALVPCAGGPLPVAGCWAVLACVGGSAAVALGAIDGEGRPLPAGFLVPVGVTAALMQASAGFPGLGVGWGLVIAAAVLGVAQSRPSWAATLGLGAAVVVGSGIGLPGVPEVAVLAVLAAAWRGWRPETDLDRSIASVVAAVAAGVVLVNAAAGAIAPDPAVVLLAGGAALAASAPLRAALGPVAAVLFAVATASVLAYTAEWIAVPLVIAGVAGFAAGSDRLADRWPARFERREDRDPLLVLALFAVGCGMLWGAFLSHGHREVLAVAAVHLAAVAGVAAIGRRWEVAASATCGTLLLAAGAFAPVPAPVQLAAILAVAWASARVAPWTHAALRMGLPAAGLVAEAVVGLGPAGWTILAVGVAAEVAAALRQDRPAMLAIPLLHAGLVLAAARILGPLAGVPAAVLLPVAVGGAVALEAAGAAVSSRRGTPWGVPVQHGAVALVALALVDSLLHGVPGTVGLAVAGALFSGRHALRGGLGDLIAGAVLLDAGALLLAAEHGVAEPLAYVAPVSLSALIVAQRLRGTVHPDALAVLRYVAAGATYVTCFGQSLGDPLYTSILVLLAIAGIAAGELLRVRSYLHLGVGFLAAALGWNLLRFGLNHAQFWALYLTGLGLAVLGGMVLLTLNREAVHRARRWVSTHLAAWER